jgi:hypothetical protein
MFEISVTGLLFVENMHSKSLFTFCETQDVEDTGNRY